ncbi:AraC family transcriptional regulator [Paenibacillus sp. PK3_47]|uniref:helix-turn-helix domain-containing protein n=1 Tax=Paenibacillus sp. PK3_47 TaxID=2072642 RepID=UPI00201DDB87|nr:AraC family transcriptional regulator [Paenibacillus sp. PK3_47]
MRQACSLSCPLTLIQLAVEAGLSRRHCIRRFQQLTGIGFSGYLQHKRTELACRLLLNDDKSK